MIQEILTALGLVCVIEGLLYALLPGHAKRMALALQEVSDDKLRMGGVSAIALGVVIVWLVRTAIG